MDVLRLPVAGSLLRWRHARLTLQLAALAAAAAIVLHGLLGPAVAPRNLAAVLTSIHWRGLLIVAIVLAGNLFCTSCPMVLVRDAGRRLVRPRRHWPRRLRRKWLALGLLVAVLFSWELFALWERPSAIAWLVLAYFGVALAIDLVFTGASFCKYVCPIGQFNFAASTVSPLELAVRDASTCGSCRTSDCVKGRYAPGEPHRLVQRGCELGLFLPAKVGNLDCTFCLDCVQACPHGNVALATRVPGAEWLAPGRRSGLGRLSRRLDLAALAAVFTAAALVSAFAMTGPAVALQRTIAQGIAAVSGPAGPPLRAAAEGSQLLEPFALGVVFLLGLVVAPAAFLSMAAAMTRRVTAHRPLVAVAVPYVFALVPFGAAVWLAHYGFHLLTGALTIVPVTQSAAIDLTGWAVLGEPLWTLTGMRSGPVFALQLGCVLLGTAGSAGLVRATAQRESPAQAAAASAPWLVLVAVLMLTAVWIFAQPMEMRGMSAAG
jgi:polyferredoxin